VCDVTYCCVLCVTMITGVLLDIHSDEIPSLPSTIQFIIIRNYVPYKTFFNLDTLCSEMFLVNKLVIISIIWCCRINTLTHYRINYD